MDCEKFESTLLDELYDELDEVTSAAAKRHVSGCARCASLLSGLKATRRVAVLPIVEPPAELEDRILAAAREAQKVIPLTRRASRAISWAGSWAMRPQTGMAAVFLLMTGLSALLLKGKHGAPSSAITVSEQGEPVPSAVTGTLERPSADTADTKEAKGAAAVALAPTTTSAASSVAASGSEVNAYAMNDGVIAHRAGPPTGRLNAPLKSAPVDLSRAVAKDDMQNSPTPPAAAPRYAYGPGAAGGGAAGGGGGLGGVGASGSAPAGPPAPAAPPPAAPALQAASSATQQVQSSASFNGAMASYNAGDYATAATLFDGLAAGGDLTSALWAARSVRRGSGCSSAVARYDQVARAGAGTTAGYDAAFEGGQCYRQMGQSDAAQARFRSLLTVTSYVDRAKNELAQMGPKASAKPQAKAMQAPATQQPQQAAPQATANKMPAQSY
jgi:hypothetical protein